MPPQREKIYKFSVKRINQNRYQIVNQELHQFDCSCNEKHIGESMKRLLTRYKERQQDSINGKSESSGTAEHTKECHGQFDSLTLNTVHIHHACTKGKSAKRLK